MTMQDKHKRESVARYILTTGYLGDGEPTCAVDHSDGRVCRFLGAKSFGCKFVCLATGENLHYPEKGFMPVGDRCPVWEAGR